MDWYAWHRRYDDCSEMRERLQAVQLQITAAIDASRSGVIRILSICAGDGRDVLGALAGRPDQRDIMTTFIEVDSRLVESGSTAITAAGLGHHCRYIRADATAAATYDGLVPVDIVVAAGILGNLAPPDVEQFIASLRWLCRADAFVIWTRNLDVSDGRRQVSAIRRTFRRNGFRQHALIRTASHVVGLHRYAGIPLTRPQDTVLFQFAGFEALDERSAEIRKTESVVTTLQRLLRRLCDRAGYPWRRRPRA